LETVPIGIGDLEVSRDRLRVLIGEVLDLDEDAEIGAAGRGRLMADEVVAVLDIVDVERTGEEHVVLELTELEEFALDHGLPMLLRTAGSQRQGGQPENGEDENGADQLLERHHRRPAVYLEAGW